MSYKKLGKYIQPVNIRNKDLKVERLLGVSIRKVLMPSIANTVGTNMKTYKIIKKHQFAYGPVTSRNGDKISIALLEDYNEAIVSQAYTVFEIIDSEVLNAEYLMMWFRRPEFDRYARYKSHGSARETFDWDELCDIDLPIPTIEKQQEIIKEYNTVVNRITLNETLNQKLEETAQALYKHWFVDFEFPNQEGKPYKTSGGEMEFNEELDMEIPFDWEVKPLVSFSDIKGGKRMPAGCSLTSKINNHPYIKVADLGTKKFAILNDKYEYVQNDIQSKIAKYIVAEGDLLISIVGTIGVIKIINKSLNNANMTENCMKITNFTKLNSSYLYHYFKSKQGQNEIEVRNVGAVQAKLPMYNIETFPITCPLDSVFQKFEVISNTIDNKIQKLQEEEILLKRIKNLLLSKMTKVEVEKEMV
ncbi:restriction endonuclease subunit S [Polaribacter sp. IC073]|uniref:restriction endonuclease subunit S n=1 Tax=Polaribacter sp. IC073 TaxID=2508540 RepID=UPI0011BF6005|nr:restriction endonuclease subunit S [Polaribacter sp. IC073]TXD49618.1 restriction endonuclease subunit S [Polaribacter sp. IC073]